MTFSWQKQAIFDNKKGLHTPFSFTFVILFRQLAKNHSDDWRKFIPAIGGIIAKNQVK